MLRRSATTRFMLDFLRKVHATVRVLSIPDVGVCHAGEALTELKTASWRTSAANSRSNLVMVTPELVKLTSCRTMLTGHFTCHENLMPYSLGLIQTPLTPCPEASV